MNETIQKSGWAIGLAGLSSIVLGVVLLVWPAPTLLTIFTAVGIFSLIWGVILIIAAVANRGSDGSWAALLLLGVISGFFGLFLLGTPAFVTGLILLLLIAVRALVIGAIMLVIGIQSVATKRKEWLLLISGSVSLLFGMFIFANPQDGALLSVLVISTYLIIDGGFLLGSGVSSHSSKK